MLKGEYTSFQYMVVYIAVMQVNPPPPYIVTRPLICSGGSRYRAMAQPFAEYVSSLCSLDSKLTAETDLAKASLSANRIISMRGTDQVNGKLISLDVGNIGEDDMGVKVQFQNVWFRYPTRDVPILNGLNLTVSKSRFPTN